MTQRTWLALRVSSLALIAFATVTLAASPPKLVVLDVELSGDRGGAELEPEHQARLKSRYLHLHDCNGCDLDLGRQLGADQVLVAWVDRVSALILSLTYEVHDVATGQISARKSFGFRGDNDTSWTRAIDYMVRDLNESATTRGTDPKH